MTCYVTNMLYSKMTEHCNRDVDVSLVGAVFNTKITYPIMR